MGNLSFEKPLNVRKLIREGKFSGDTSGISRGYAQANLVVLPQKLAYDFLLFAFRNPKPCPIIDVTEIGSKEFRKAAPGSDVTTDLPKYKIFKYGELVDEVTEISKYWKDDYVAFLLGCSYTFESNLIEEGIRMKHIENDSIVPMYVTNIECDPAGQFSGPTVVSMRPIPRNQLVRAVQITSRYPGVHGSPVHIGDPKAIGIEDINKPDFGDMVEIEENEVPVFWACGVTPQVVAMKVKPEIMITHSPGHMFITDIKNHEIAVF